MKHKSKVTKQRRLKINELTKYHLKSNILTCHSRGFINQVLQLQYYDPVLAIATHSFHCYVFTFIFISFYFDFSWKWYKKANFYRILQYKSMTVLSSLIVNFQQNKMHLFLISTNAGSKHNRHSYKNFVTQATIKFLNWNEMKNFAIAIKCG